MPHPIELGQKLAKGTVIAWGYYREDEEAYILSVFVLLDEPHRIPNVKNYALVHYWPDTGSVTNAQTFANLVQATRVWENEYGMDI